jgi:adenylate cyclase
LAWLEVDNVRIKGKTQVTRIYTLVESAIEPQNATFATLARVHERMLAAYRCGQFASAASLAKQACDLATPRLYALYEIYERRCRALERSRPEG